MSPSTPITYECRGRVAWITIDRPEVRNAVDRAMAGAIAEAVARAGDDDGVRALVLTGGGDRVFVAGADLDDFPADPSEPAALRSVDRAFETAAGALEDCPKPTVARLNGHTVGAGVALAIACDLRLMQTDAMAWIPVSRIGLIYSPEDHRRLVGLIGPARAKWLLLSGARIDAAKAEAWGLVDEIAPADQFDAALARLLDELVGGAPLTQAHTKRFVAALGRGAPLDEPAVQAAYAEVYASDDHREALAAIREKRAPVFTGR